MIRFGPWSTTLGLAAGFGALVAFLLWHAPGNRAAHRLLAALLLVAVPRLMPYVLGFAGAYDAWPWLSFAPFQLGLAIGPLLYLYLLRLATPALPPRWGWHLLPAALELTYLLAAFALPLDRKMTWNEQVHEPWVAPLLVVAGTVSLAVYLVLALQLRRRYLQWLRENVSDQDARRQPWIGTTLASLGLWLLVSTGFDLYSSVVGKLSYYDRFPQYLAFSAIVLWLGLEGWRYAGQRFPQMAAPPLAIGESPAATTVAGMPAVETLVAPATEPLSAAVTQRTPETAIKRDWNATAATWRAQIRDQGWWRQPGLSLADVARYLGTNDSYISRAFNQGMGQNFNAVINAMRVEAVQSRMLADVDAELLTLALDCGFSSKASFNRVFREQSGATPSAWRAAHITKSGAISHFEATAPGSQT